MQSQIVEEVKAKLKVEKATIEKTLREGLKEETAEQIQSLKQELDAKSLQVKDLNNTKAEVERLKREKEEVRGVVAYGSVHLLISEGW
jgi:hypothetical protein